MDWLQAAASVLCCPQPRASVPAVGEPGLAAFRRALQGAPAPGSPPLPLSPGVCGAAEHSPLHIQGLAGPLSLSWPCPACISAGQQHRGGELGRGPTSGPSRGPGWSPAQEMSSHLIPSVPRGAVPSPAWQSLPTFSWVSRTPGLLLCSGKQASLEGSPPHGPACEGCGGHSWGRAAMGWVVCPVPF